MTSDAMCDAFPFYMSIGVSYEDYWFNSPYIAMYARKANYLAIERKNQELWMQGLYFYDALGVALSNAFSDGKHKAQKYMEKPMDILPKTERELRLEQERARQQAIDELNLWAKKWSKAHG